MSSTKYLAYDMSSFAWHDLSGGKDKEHGYTVIHNEKEVYVNSAQYGYDSVMQRMLEAMERAGREARYSFTPNKAILVFEGVDSKRRRLLIDARYKASGGSRPPEQYEEFQKLREMLKATWKKLGAQVMWQDQAEGDDTLGWLAQNTEDDLVIATFDNDIAVLNQDANAYGARVSTLIGMAAGGGWLYEHCKYHGLDFDLITTYKALVGDTSDNIKGCPGLADGKFTKLLEQYGEDGIREIHEMLCNSNLDPLAEYAEDPDNKLLKLIYDNRAEVIRSFDLAKIRPEWVNTMKKPLVWEPGLVMPYEPDMHPKLAQWCATQQLVTAGNFDQLESWILEQVARGDYVSLDIETSTPDESDEWLAAMGKEDKAVDVFGSYLVGLGLTFGDNSQHTVYISVKHADTPNVPSERVRQLIAKIPQDKTIVIHNVGFELPVLFNEWAGRQPDNGYHGFLPSVRDTALEASYVDENVERGLKARSLSVLGYRQQTYDETTVLTAPPEQLPPGGKPVRTNYKKHTVIKHVDGVELEVDAFDEEPTGRLLVEQYEQGARKRKHAAWLTPEEAISAQLDGKLVDFESTKPEMRYVVESETRRYKMHELTAEHVCGYGADDPYCTAALHNYFKLHMQLEHQYEVYKEVELDAAYQHAKNFIDGCDTDQEKLNELAAEDAVVYDKAWAVLREYLIEKGWTGTQPPSYDPDITTAQVKEAYEIVVGRPIGSNARNIDKLAKFAMSEDDPAAVNFGTLLLRCCEAPEGQETDDAFAAFTAYVCKHFSGEPQFNDGSPKQMQRLMYEVMGLPIRVRNKPTDQMRKSGIMEGTPKTDSLAIAYAMLECGEREKEVLDALKLMAMVGTRRSLYYDKYPYFPHWKDGKVRSQHNQAATNTRRASESNPNKQQLPKHAKIEGYASRFREVIVPHKPDAVIVSIDFKAQELRIIADYSKDAVMLSMYIGDNLRDQHHLTGLAIAQKRRPVDNWTYESFSIVLEDKKQVDYPFVKECRNLGKKLNFTAEYGAMAAKVAQTLIISEDDAQAYLDAREAMFPDVQVWKDAVIKEAKEIGYVTTKMGARRHLAPAFMSDDKWEASKAERQAVNFKVQGSSAEQTKLAEGRMWRDNLFYDFDAVCIGPIHDEVVASVLIKDLPEFLPRMHAAMVAPYADMAVPIMGDISFGLNFFKQIEIGPVPSREAIEKGLAEMWEKEAEERKEAA